VITNHHPSRASVRIVVVALGVLVHSLVGVVVGRRSRTSSSSSEIECGGKTSSVRPLVVSGFRV
jgi:hypothetical protein